LTVGGEGDENIGQASLHTYWGIQRRNIKEAARLSGDLTPIDSIELREISLPLVERFEASYGAESSKEALLVFLKKENLLAFGECVAGTGPSYGKETAVTAKQVIKKRLSPFLLTSEMGHPDEFLDATKNLEWSNMAVAAVEMALWDLKGKMENTSLSMLLGGHGEEIGACATIGINFAPKQLVDSVSRYVGQGYRTIKLKIKPSYDIEFVSAVRSEFRGLDLRVDANGAYSMKDLNTLKALDKFDLSLIEQPLAFDDLSGHQNLQKELATPICLDESIQSPGDAKKAIAMETCQAVNIKPGRVGGLRHSILIHDICAEHNVPVLCGGMLETGVGRAFDVALATLPGFSFPGDLSASKRYFKRDLIRKEFVLTENGTLTVPTEPGCGVLIDDDFLDSVTKSKEVLSN
jgi:O-succinylbenzoate synthase